MNSPYNFLKNVLISIEDRLKDNINVDTLANDFHISTTHLHRLFKFAFDQTIGSYIRSRKLAASIDDLLNTDMDIIDIALEYDFEYEQSYIRSFKREYGVTPGNFRKKGTVIKITPPLHLFESQKDADDLLFGPHIVMVPKFHLVGKRHKMPFRDDLVISPKHVLSFVNNERHLLKNALNPDVIFNICNKAEDGAEYCYNMPSVQVKNIRNIPEGLDCDTFNPSLCARFRFIGKTINELNMHGADKMFQAIDNFMDDENQKYFLERKRLNIEIIDHSMFDKGIYLWEWFAPVRKKTDKEIAKTSGIIKTHKQKIPALRFIGKKCEITNGFSGENTLDYIDKWRLEGIFDTIEKQSEKNLKTLYDGGNAYISLLKSKNGEVIEHWMGIFMPEGTKVPEGFNKIDFHKTTIDVCTVYGKRNEIVNFDDICRKKLEKEKNKTIQWYFQRFNWHRFFEEDMFGKRLLDYCYFTN